MSFAEIILKIPGELAYQVVYRQERGDPFSVRERDNVSFSFVAGPSRLWPHRVALRKILGEMGFIKALVKLCTKRRLFYCVLHGQRVAATGWCTVSFCRHYKVEPGSVIIGPIWTAEHMRGKGIATHALKQALNALMKRGHLIFYIDTSGDNLPSQRVIAKCGFGPPVALYIR